jgi:hypothetical protein
MITQVNLSQQVSKEDWQANRQDLCQRGNVLDSPVFQGHVEDTFHQVLFDIIKSPVPAFVNSFGNLHRLV